MNSVSQLHSKEGNALKRINEDTAPFEHAAGSPPPPPPAVTSGTNNVIPLAKGLKPFSNSGGSADSYHCTENCTVIKRIFF
jgi:hypothetical protein